MKDFFGINWGMLSAALIFVSGYPYMRAIHKRTLERPVTSTWCLWLGIGILLFVTNFQAGAKWETTLLPILMGVINPAIIVVLSLRYGEYKWNKLDTLCVIVCIITIIVWKTTESPSLGIVGGLMADAVAATPIFIKSWKDPKDEPLFPWAVFAFASSLNILAVEKWTMDRWLFPIYMTIASMIIVLPLVLYRLRLRKV